MTMSVIRAFIDGALKLHFTCYRDGAPTGVGHALVAFIHAFMTADEAERSRIRSAFSQLVLHAEETAQGVTQAHPGDWQELFPELVPGNLNAAIMALIVDPARQRALLLTAPANVPPVSFMWDVDFDNAFLMMHKGQATTAVGFERIAQDGVDSIVQFLDRTAFPPPEVPAPASQETPVDTPVDTPAGE